MNYPTAEAVQAQTGSSPAIRTGKAWPLRVPAELTGPMLALLVVALFAVNALMHYPGTMNNDSITQYSQAIRGRYSDWHPPIMAWLWSWLRLANNGPGPLLLLHLALY